MWTRHLLLCQRAYLKMGYLRKTQKRAKLLRQIRQHMINEQRQSAINPYGDILHEVVNTQLQKFTQLPVSNQEEKLPNILGKVFPQCMNAIRSPNRPKINKRVQVT